MKNCLKKILPTFVYVAAVTGVIALLMWHGSGYDYAYRVELGGDTPLSGMFPQPDPPEAAKPQIVSRATSDDSNEAGSLSPGEDGSKPPNPDNTDSSGHSGNSESDPSESSGGSDPPSPGEGEAGAKTDPPGGEPGIPLPAGLRQIYSETFEDEEDEDGGVIFAAEFDLESKTVRFSAKGLSGAERAPTVCCRLLPGVGNAFSAEGDGITDMLMTLWDDATLTVQSKSLCRLLGYDNPIYDGLLTLYAQSAAT